jgi:hypothetical protein
MVTLSRKNKVLIAATVVVALTFILALPYVYALTPNDPTLGMKTLKAQGIAAEKVDNQTVKSEANFTLSLQPTETNSTLKKFSVFGGTVEVKGAVYTITGGNGAVLTRRRVILLQAQGTGPDGQAVTLKLAGRYFWMGGRLYVARIVGKLQTDNGNFLLLLRADIRI